MNHNDMNPALYHRRNAPKGERRRRPRVGYQRSTPACFASSTPPAKSTT